LVEGGAGAAGDPVLTAAGWRLLAESFERRQRERRKQRPRWDPRRRALWWRGQVVKELRREAPAQETVLWAFAAAGWPERIDDPMEDEPGIDRKRRLNQTIKDLNERLAAGTIRFHGDGTATGVCWRVVQA
jgi:hypothetical protein